MTEIRGFAVVDTTGIAAKEAIASPSARGCVDNRATFIAIESDVADEVAIATTATFEVNCGESGEE